MQRQQGLNPARAAKIHIGKYKTGTTSFQHYLDRQRERLLAAGIFVVPRAEALLISAAVIRDGLPIPSVFYCRDKGMDTSQEALRQRFQALIAGLPPFHTVLLSCEDLSYFRTQTEIDEFRDLLADLFTVAPERMEITMVLRDHDDFLASYRAQISAMGFLPVRERLSPYYCEPDSWLVDDDRLVRLWAQNFASTTVLDYHPEGMVSLLARALDLPLRDEADEIYLNTRRSRAQIVRKHVKKRVSRVVRGALHGALRPPR